MTEVTNEVMEALINLFNNGINIEKNRWWCVDGDKFIELDNTDGRCYVSEWFSKDCAFLRCLGYIDGDGVPVDHDKFYEHFFRLVKHINEFEGDSSRSVYESMGMPAELADW